MYVIMAVLNPFFKEVDGYSFGNLYGYHVERGHYMLFFSSETFSTNWNLGQNKTIKHLESTKFNSVQFPDILFALFSYFTNTSQYIVVYHADLLVNVMALTLWCATTFFINTLKQQVCKQAIVNYDALKILTGCINSVAGTVVLTYTVDSILYYATNLESLFTGRNWFSKVVVVQFLLSSITWLHFASHACLQVPIKILLKSKAYKFMNTVTTKQIVLKTFRWTDFVTGFVIKITEQYCRPKVSLLCCSWMKFQPTLLDSPGTASLRSITSLSHRYLRKFASFVFSLNLYYSLNIRFVLKLQAITTVMTYFILVIQFK